ncbi:IPT/TIG domain-containing protein [Hymenobacter negativus]|uniref:IPT/TIG domain-containing protein n=1 Tax=Hymenobacter negativus TaxID=2795026 RepID=A0ABS3QAF4_9BACT|nr:IPT/TIG domain-containing protein [Hymenobacter negativus]MBO2008240.1 hypothetical protein [Hymenobacter negativus]
MLNSLPFNLSEGRLGRLVVLVWLALGLAGAARATGTEPTSPTPSLASALNPDGTLRAGLKGSFDARQFVMENGADGHPIFRPARVARIKGAGDEKWADGFGLPNGLNGTVRAVVRSGTRIYVGGTFSVAGGVPANNVALWNGTAWSALGTGSSNGVNSDVRALALAANGDLYVGGSFTKAGKLVTNRLAKWDGTAWSTLGTGSTNGVNDLVYALAIATNGNLYVGGRFSSAGGVTARGVARWDGTTWSSFGTGTTNGVNNTVFALTLSGTDMYVGGNFSQAGGTAASYVARWDGTAWSALGTGSTNGTDNTVNAIAVAGATVYVGGTFRYVGGTSFGGGIAANYVARWTSASGWSSLTVGATNGFSLGSTVSALAAVGTEVYVGGQFNAPSGTSSPGLVKWTGTAWVGLGTGTYPVLALSATSTDVYAGGIFTVAGGAIANRVARWNGSAWSGLGTGTGTGANGYVRAVAVVGSNVYIGGEFTAVGTVAANYVARWNGSAWSSLGTGAANGTNNYVYALATNGTDLYVGGSFPNAGGLATGSVARWNGSAWSSLGTGTGGTVYALATNGTDVYAGGQLTTAGGVAVNNLARWNGAAWGPVGSASANGVNFVARALALQGTTLYVGGNFSSAGGVAANNIAQWNGTTWSTLGSGTNNGVNSEVNALVVANGALYVGGSFYEAGGGGFVAGGARADKIAKWNGSVWSSLTSTGSPNGFSTGLYDGIVYALAVNGTDVYAGGSFTAGLSSSYAPNVPLRNIGRWDGNAWRPLGTGLDADAYALGLAGNILAAGGAFSAVGDTSKAMTAVGFYDGPTARTLTSFSPGTGPAGTSIVLTGTGFLGTTAVMFNNTNAPGFVINSATQITVTVPAGATTGRIRLVSSDGTTSSSTNFLVTASPPNITSFTPTSGPVGTTVVITGTGFTGTTAVKFNGVAATSFTFINDSEVRAVVATGSGTGSISVTAAGGTGSSGSPFSLLPAPVITGYGPSLGPVGTSVMITGNYFVSVTQVTFNGMSASFVVNSSTQLTATVPAGATTGPLGVTTGSGTGVTTSVFTVLPSPTLTSLNPGSATTGSYISLNGTNLTGAYAITFPGGVTVNSGFVVNAAGTQITNVLVPTGASSGNVTVTTSNGTSNGVSFYLLQPPTFTSFTPYYSYWGGRTSFFGSFFRRGPAGGKATASTAPAVTSVTFNGVPASFTIISDTELEAIVPTGATTGPVVITNDDGSVTTPHDYIVAENRTVSTGALASPTTVPFGIFNDLTVTGTGVAQLTDSTRVIGTLTVQAGGVLLTNCQPLVGKGNFVLAAGATLGVCDAAGLVNGSATGAVKLSGTRSLSPDASYLYNGSQAQVTGTGLPASVASFTLTNPTGLTLSQNLTATQALTLSDGPLRTGAFDATLGPTATVAEAGTGYLIGNLLATRALTTAGQSQDFGGMGLTLTPAATSAVLPGATTVRRVTGTAPTGAGHFGISRYFDIQAANSNGLNVTMEARYRDEELNGLPENKLIFYRSTSSAAGPWTAQNAPHSRDALNNRITLAGVSGFSQWALGDPSTPLPVELTAFSATAQGTGVALAWRTASERSSAYFQVERSTDGTTFKALTQVPAQGNRTAPTDYAFTDATLPASAPQLYYRLKQVDTDGTATYSAVRTVARPLSALALYPNPAQGTTKLNLPALPQVRTVLLLDVVGRELRRFSLPADASAVPLNLAGLAPGLYTVRCDAASAPLVVE